MALRIGGVPEHFNEPWHDVLKLASSATWISYPGGTGAMCESLQKKEIDCALLLTEGAVKYCLEKRDCLLHSVYVASPLVWGVHVGEKSRFKDFTLSSSESSDREVTFAISRFGSGSHLMAFVLARQMKWNRLRFEVVGNLKGAQEFLQNTPDALFMWEKAMTDPLVKRGVFKRIGQVPTPWPCFVLAVRKDISTEQGGRLKSILEEVKRACGSFKENRSKSIDRVVGKFGIEKHLVEEWFDQLRFGSEEGFDQTGLRMLEMVRDTLVTVGQLPQSLQTANIAEITVNNPSETRAKL